MINCQSFYFSDDGTIPNNPAYPLLYYPQALSVSHHNASKVLQQLDNHGWTNGWVNGIFSYHHYHSNVHEILAVVSGSAKVMLWGKEGREISFSESDAVLIPAGVGHCRLSSTRDFRVVCAYAGGRTYDLCKGKPEERPQVLENIKEVPVPESDPVTGNKDPLYHHWKNWCLDWPS